MIHDRTDYTALSVGDTIPLDGTRKPFGAACDLAWFILTTGRTRKDMIGAKAWLSFNGAQEAWFPEETARRTIRRNGLKPLREAYDRPVVPGLLFLLSDRLPQWDVLVRRKGIRPMQIGDKPVVVSEAVMAEMENVPNRIAELRAAVIEAERAEREANRPMQGGQAVFLSGPFAGRVVDIHAIEGETAVVLIDSIRVRADIDGLRRKA